MNVAILLLVILLLIALFLFSINSVNIVSETNKNNFAYTIKIRKTLNELDKIVEHADITLNILSNAVIDTYDINKKYDKKYNEMFLERIDVLVKEILLNSPGVTGSWLQMSVETPFGDDFYNWYMLKNGKMISLRKKSVKVNGEVRKLNPEDDPYYFEAVKAKKTIWSEIYTDVDANTQMMTISRPVYKDGELICVVGIDISVMDLQNVLAKMQKAFEGSEIFLLDSNKNFLLSQLCERCKDKKANPFLYDSFKSSTKNEEELIEYNDNGVNKTAIIMNLPNEYHLLITFPKKLIFKGFDRLFRTIYFGLAILTALAIVALMNRIRIIKINKQLENEILTQKAIIDSAPSAMIIKSVDGSILDCNSKLLDMMGCKKENILGKTVYDIFPKDIAEPMRENEKQVIATKQMLIEEQRFYDRKGEEAFLKTYHVPLFNNSGTVIGLLINSVDITALRQEQNLLKKAKDSAEQATAMKSNFLANMSHEIRTPMNGVLGFLQLLEETETSEIQKEFIEDAQKSSEILLNIINEILDFSKIEAGKFQLDNVSFDIRSAVEDVTIIATSSAYSKGIDVNSLICSEVPQKVFGDPGRVKQILNNLVGNAIKFTQQGDVVIYVNQLSETDDEVVVGFKVKDTGIGIAEDKLKLIFEAFSQGDASTTRKFGGTGLGLAISQKLAGLMNGTITVESQENVGSTFTLRIPFKKDNISVENHNDARKQLSGVNVLVVDNNPIDLKIIRYYLSAVNCIVQEANSFEEALRTTSKPDNNISVVLIDDKMQNAEGGELSTLIKNCEHSKDIPLILYASLTKRGDSALAKQKGFSGYLTKPFKQNDLLECISMVIEGGNGIGEESFVTKHLIKENNFSSKVKILAVEDCELNCKLIVRVLSNFGLACDVAFNGKDAIEAFKTKKYDLILMDCEMPIMDGYEATRKIREYEQSGVEPVQKPIPIIAMTANVLNTDRDKCLSAGMDNYISKPLNIVGLKKLLDDYIKLCEPADKAEDKAEAKVGGKVAAKSNADDDGYIENIIGEMMVELEFTKCEAIQLFAQYLEQLPDAISQLETAVVDSDFDAAKKIAHKLKGSSANLRIERISQLSEKIESEILEQDMASCLTTVKQIKTHMEYLNGFNLQS